MVDFNNAAQANARTVRVIIHIYQYKDRSRKYPHEKKPSMCAKVTYNSVHIRNAQLVVLPDKYLLQQRPIFQAQRHNEQDTDDNK